MFWINWSLVNAAFGSLAGQLSAMSLASSVSTNMRP